MPTQPSIRRRKPFLHMDVKLLNHKEDVHLQWKLQNISTKYRLVLRLLEQERELVLREHHRLLHLRVCEPHATINKTMRVISEVKMANDQRKTRSSQSALAFRASSVLEPTDDARFIKSALMLPIKRDVETSTMLFNEKFKASDNGQLSVLQLKDLALIDSISEKELRYREECYRRYKERLKQLQREQLRQKISSFLSSI